jgi:D-alanyl-D-alanine carboxypeptidase
MTMRQQAALASLCVLVTVLAGCGRSGKRPAGSASAAAASRAVPPPPPVSVGWLDSVAGRYAADKHLVGLSVGVAQDGKIVFAKGYGYASLADRTPVTPQTMFAIGSVTKQFTCSAVLLLAEDKKLTMQDPVSKYFPKLTRASDITLRDLGNHVSGYRDYYPLDFVDREMATPTTADDVITEYATRPLDFEPGTRWSYSNTGFLILGRVVEQVSREPFGAFLARRVFTPLGMQHTLYDPPAGTAGMATGYTTFALGAPTPVAPEGAGWDGMAGALKSTPSDLLAWDLALVGGKVLSPDSYRTLTRVRRLADGRSTGYACGDGVNERGEALVLSHGGAVSGFTAQNTVVPATRSAVVLMTNSDFGSLGELSRAILAKLMPHVTVPAIQGPPALEAATAFLRRLEKGQVDRAMLGDDFGAYLNPGLLASARRTLAGGIQDIQVVGTAERGGMEVAELRFKVGSRTAAALMYRTPDGKIQEFLVYAP